MGKLLLMASAVMTASIASFILSLVMIGIVLASRRCGINPDNVAAPIAGMLGDFCTLALLSGIADLLWSISAKNRGWPYTFSGWVKLLILLFYLFIVTPLTARLAYRYKETRRV